MMPVDAVAVFPLLTDPAGTYRPCDTDLLVNDGARAYWLELFESHFDVQLEAAATTGVAAAALARAREAMTERIEALRREPDLHGDLDILVLDAVRHEVLVAHGIHDEFRLVKERENEAALLALPHRLAALDALDPAARLEALVTGMLAGNLFDMGSRATAGRFTDGSLPFDESLAAVPARPWRVDDVDAAAADLGARPPRRAVLFADNAGADLVLGVLPLARHLLLGGAEVIVTVNSEPNLNDVTIDEIGPIVERATGVDEAFARPALRLVDSGCIAPLIDLSRVSDDLVRAAAGADLVVLVGMGRAVESNWSARFACRSLRVAMIKDPQVAETIGGELYDAICRFEPPAAP
jgi:type II pantothenate kinase